MFIGRGGTIRSAAQFERMLFLIRKRVENGVLTSGLPQKSYFYVGSLSCKTIVYKGMLSADQIEGYFPDITDPAVESALALVHQRFSTNTFPTWSLAHPFRYLAHNGEINTLRGNINWMRARERLFQSEFFDDRLRDLLPVIREGGSDYALNKGACRLKDIFDLFRDTGLGANSYAIIEQGMVDRVLSDRADERRLMFEEAAGIGRYKDRRKGAQRRLEQAEQDLARLDDVLREVETQVRSLARQSKRAQRYQEMRRKRLSLEVAVATTELEEARAGVVQATERLARLSQDEPAARAALFAKVDLGVNVAALATQALATGRIVAAVGLGGALALVPALSVAGFGLVAAVPGVWALGAFQMLRRAAHFGVERPSREVLFTVVPPEDKYKAKSFVDTFVVRAGDTSSGWLHAGLAGLGLALPALSLAAIPFAAGSMSSNTARYVLVSGMAFCSWPVNRSR